LRATAPSQQQGHTQGRAHTITLENFFLLARPMLARPGHSGLCVCDALVTMQQQQQQQQHGGLALAHRPASAISKRENSKKWEANFSLSLCLPAWLPACPAN